MLVLKLEELLLRLKSESSPLNPNRSLELKEKNIKNSHNSSKRDLVILMNKFKFLQTLSSSRDFVPLLKLKLWTTNFSRLYPWDLLLIISLSPLFKMVPRVVKLSSLENYNNKEPKPWNSNKDIWSALVNPRTIILMLQ